MNFFRLPNHTLKLKALDQLQCASEESLLLKLKATNVFPKSILKSKAGDQPIQAKKKLFCYVIVNNHLHSILRKLLIKIESTWKREIKEQTPQLTLLYRSRMSEAATGCVL